MMSLLESSTSLLAACGGDTVKVFDVSVKSGDPCILSYSPSPGSHVNSIKWNHTNLVVASAGDDKKISLWHKNGQSIGIVPLSNSNADDDLEESIVSINFSNKSSRYICSGGSGRVVRIWDLQRKRCIKWLSGHTDTITGVMYNCKDEHLASISLKGDLILHNLASGARAADFKDPFGQVLRVLDFSRLSRHILVMAGDDGSIHMVDTIGRAPKVSWLKQHSAPTTGVCFSPSSDKIIASVGLDKKLYTFDSAMRKPTACIPYEAPFSSLTYSDDGNILTAGTNGGLVVFYDVRGKPQPFTILHSFSSSEAVTSLCWQRSKPYVVNESNCTSEIALLGGASEDSILMPDPRPSVSTSSFSTVMLSTSRPSQMVSASGSMSTTSSLSTAEETPIRSSLWRGGSLAKLQAPRGNFNLKDDMDVFSPLVDVQPITPSLSSLWDDHDEEKKESSFLDKKPLTFQNTTRRFPFTEAEFDVHRLSDWRSSTTSRQDDMLASQMVCTPVASSKSDSSFSPVPEERVGNAMLDKSSYHQQFLTVSRQFPSTSLATSSTFTSLQDSSSSTIQSTKSVLTNPAFSSLNQQTKAIFTNEKPSAYLESSSFNHSTSVSVLLDTKQVTSANFEIPGPVHSVLPRRYTTYADRLITASSLSDGISSSIISPKSKKTGSETREELLSSLLSRQDSTAATGNGSLQTINGMATQPLRASGQPSDLLGNSSFSLQLVQRTLEETLGSMQKSIHDDVKNLHIDLLRQFHMQEMVMSNLLNSVLEKQEELIKEVQTLRRENQQLRQLL